MNLGEIASPSIFKHVFKPKEVSEVRKMNERNSPENFSLRVGESEKYIDCLESRSNGEFHAAVLLNYFWLWLNTQETGLWKNLKIRYDLHQKYAQILLQLLKFLIYRIRRIFFDFFFLSFQRYIFPFYQSCRYYLSICS